MLKIVTMCALALLGTLSALDNEGEKAKVYQRFQDLGTAFNADQEDKFADFWTADSEFIKPLTGEILQGKEAIVQFLKERAQEIKKRQLKFSFKPTKIDFPNADSAVVFGIVEIADNKGALLQRNVRRIELAKQNGQWYIDSVKEIEVAPPPPGYDHMKELGWLIGKWVDKDEDMNITFSTDWDKFKNFIVQRFKMEVLGVDTMEGLQVIGWDPIEQKFRSWVYDSDGGFGSGLWTKEGAEWKAKMDYVLSDGKKATSVNVYKPVDDKSYIFSSTNRTVAGEAIPDIEPATVVKEE